MPVPSDYHYDQDPDDRPTPGELYDHEHREEDEDHDVSAAPEGIKQEHWDLATRSATLGVGHIWTEVSCPAYRTLDPADCTCQGMA